MAKKKSEKQELEKKMKAEDFGAFGSNTSYQTKEKKISINIALEKEEFEELEYIQIMYKLHKDKLPSINYRVSLKRTDIVRHLISDFAKQIRKIVE